VIVGDVCQCRTPPPLPGAGGALWQDLRRLLQREETSMRVLVASVPAAGHFHPLVPLALALRDAGAQVMVASAASVCERARAIGFAAAPVGTEVEQWLRPCGRLPRSCSTAHSQHWRLLMAGLPEVEQAERYKIRTRAPVTL
jgi:hypothetical protein